MNRVLIIAVAAFALLGGAYLWQNSHSPALPDLNLGMAEAQTSDTAEADQPLVAEMALGDENAPLTVIEYASATCPHCKNFHEGTFKQIKQDYIDTGKVRFVYREVYFDRFGLWAGMVARCGGPERYFGIMDMIFEQQSDWAKGDSPAAIADNLATIGKTAGLTGDEIDACLQDEPKARAMIAEYQKNADEHGIRSTPSFIIGGELATGDMSYEDFSALLDAKLDD